MVRNVLLIVLFMVELSVRGRLLSFVLFVLKCLLSCRNSVNMSCVFIRFVKKIVMLVRLMVYVGLWNMFGVISGILLCVVIYCCCMMNRLKSSIELVMYS